MRVLFCSILFFLVFFSRVALVRAQQAENTMTYTARVPVSSTFAYVIRKNSTVNVQHISPTVGDVVEVRVNVLGEQNVPLKNHRARMIVYTHNEETLIIRETTTNARGQAVFSLEITTMMQNASVASFFDTTYDESIALRASVLLDVRAARVPVDDDEQRRTTLWILEITVGVGETRCQALVCYVDESDCQAYAYCHMDTNASNLSHDAPRVAARDGPRAVPI